MKKKVCPIFQDVRGCSIAGDEFQWAGKNLEILRTGKHSRRRPASGDLSLHFPEGSVIKLKFRLTRQENHLPRKNEYFYELAEIELVLEKVKLGLEAIQLIRKDMDNVSLRHTS